MTSIAQRTAHRTVTLRDAAGRPEARSVEFVEFVELRLWASSTPVAAVSRSRFGKWFARWLIVRGSELASGRLEERVDLMGKLVPLGRWSNTVAKADRATNACDWGAPSRHALRQRIVELDLHDPEPGSVNPDGSLRDGSSHADLTRRQTELSRQLHAMALAALPADANGSQRMWAGHFSTTHELWSAAVHARLATPAEAALARAISATRDPLDWHHAGD